jgi:hypothetical protein
MVPESSGVGFIRGPLITARRFSDTMLIDRPTGAAIYCRCDSRGAEVRVSSAASFTSMLTIWA